MTVFLAYISPTYSQKTILGPQFTTREAGLYNQVEKKTDLINLSISLLRVFFSFVLLV